MLYQFWDYNLRLLVTVSIAPMVPEVNGNVLIPAVSFVGVEELVIRYGYTGMRLIYSRAPV